MSFDVTVERPMDIVPEGKYLASVVDVRGIEGRYGQMAKIDLMISGDDECEGRQVSGVARMKLCENTKFGRWVAAILGRFLEVGENVTATDLIGKDCFIVVKHRTSPDGKTFANVTDVLAQTAPQ